MSAEILDGKSIAKALKEELKAQVERLVAAGDPSPTLAIVQADSDPAAAGYARVIVKACEDTGMTCTLHTFSAQEAEHYPHGLEQHMLARIAELNMDRSVHGILLQEPLPAGVRASVLAEALSPAKDVDGINPANAGHLLGGTPGFVPATPLGGLELLRRYQIPLSGKHAVVVGRSTIVGKPMALLLLAEHATVTICHSRTVDLAMHIRQADIVVAAVGKPGLIKADMVKPGATVIDFGTTYEGKDVYGDVDFTGVREVAGAITPVPGGTGPMTAVTLLRNVLVAAERQIGYRA